MPRVTVTADAHSARSEPLVLLDERVELVHVANRTGAEQLLERVRWALADAEERATRDRRRRLAHMPR
ncbi:MAG TPA: hypothetical protein VMA83_11620 [Solirubrobacteraceae bacterium]|nr:hypothetical protein [Solirubrobacteraceae bacterium]